MPKQWFVLAIATFLFGCRTRPDAAVEDASGSRLDDISLPPDGSLGAKCAALQLTEANSYATAEPLLLSASIRSFTIEAWIYPTSALESQGAVIMGQFDDDAYVPFKLVLTRAMTLSSTVQGDAGTFDFEGSARVQLGKWSHVAAVVDAGDQRVRFFVDGKLDIPPQDSFPSLSANTNYPFRIGGAPPSIGAPGTLLGYVSHVEVSDIARYKESFVPAEQAVDVHTIASFPLSDPVGLARAETNSLQNVTLAISGSCFFSSPPICLAP